MGRSQRHKVFHQGQAANGEWVAQGAINPVVEDILREEFEQNSPTLDYLAPDYGTVGGADLNVSCLGQNFDNTCVVVFGGADIATTFRSDTEVEFMAPLSTMVEGTYSTLVKKGEFKTNTVPFGVLPVEAYRR